MARLNEFTSGRCWLLIYRGDQASMGIRIVCPSETGRVDDRSSPASNPEEVWLPAGSGAEGAVARNLDPTLPTARSGQLFPLLPAGKRWPPARCRGQDLPGHDLPSAWRGGSHP